MSTAIVVTQPSHIEANWQVWLVRAATTAIVLYAIVCPIFTAPSRFPIADASSYDAQLHGPPIQNHIIKLELPASGEELAGTLHADIKDQHPSWHSAQLDLYRQVQAWDNVFIELYVLQFLSVVVLVPSSDSSIRLFKYLAALFMMVAGIFDWMENFYISGILDKGAPPFGDLVNNVTFASERKWAALAVSYLILSYLIRNLPGASRAMRTTLVGVLLAAGITGGIGCLPAFRGLLPISVGIYAIMPLVIFWHFVLGPVVTRMDRRARAFEAANAQSFVSLGRHEFAAPSSAKPRKWSLKELEK